MEEDKMKKMTSAYANKLLKSLDEDKQFWLNKEASSCTYIAADGEEPVIPEYDYKMVADTIAEIDKKVCAIKHAVNLNNATAQITVGDSKMSVDMILISMAQLNNRKVILDQMRKEFPKTRETSMYYSKNSAVEYKYINYDLELIKQEYERVSDKIMEMQLALDKYNQLVEFEVDI